MRMIHWLEKRADLTPDRIALIGVGERVTFGELRRRAIQTAGKLAEIGARRGSLVALLCNNGLHVPELIHAIHYTGAAVVTLNTRLTAYELEYQLRDSGCSLLIHDDGLQSAAAEIKMAMPELDVIGWSRLQAAPCGGTADLVYDIDTEALHSIMYTSGTTGHPKGVMYTYDNHWASAVGSVLNLGFTEQDCWLACLPLFHISGLSILMKNVIYGMPVVIHEKFAPEAVNRSIREDRVTIVSVVSAMLSKLLDELGDERYPARFRCMLLGGGPAPLPLLEACRGKGIPVVQTYGMTETSSQIVTLPSEYMLSKLGSAGKPLFQSELRIVLADGKEAPPTVPGEITVRGPNVSKGYWNRPEATKEAMRDGWLHTGDIGYVDEDGFLYVLDRRKDLIISGGENVYPAEVEAALLGHPAIAEAGVAAMDDEVWGQVPVAYIVVRPGHTVTEEEVRDYCSRKLAKYKIPAKVHVVNALPRNASNKLLRRELSKLAKA